MSSGSLARSLSKTCHRSNTAANNTAAVSHANSAPLALANAKSHVKPFHDLTDYRRTDEYALDSYAHILDVYQW